MNGATFRIQFRDNSDWDTGTVTSDAITDKNKVLSSISLLTSIGFKLEIQAYVVDNFVRSYSVDEFKVLIGVI